MLFRHYRSKHYTDALFHEVENSRPALDVIHSKPRPGTGLWGSIVYNNEDTWENWCVCEGLNSWVNTDYFNFRLKSDSRVCVVSNWEEGFNLILKYKREPNPDPFNLYDRDYIDYNKLKLDYDALVVLLNKDSRLDELFSYWDVASVLVLNKDVVEEV